MDKEHWSVTVERNGEKVVTIESNCLSGREIGREDESVIRKAADHLLAFVGGPTLDESKPRPEACIQPMKCGWHKVRTEPDINYWSCHQYGCPHMPRAD